MFDQIGLATKIKQIVTKILKVTSRVAKGEKKNGLNILNYSTMIVHASMAS